MEAYESAFIYKERMMWLHDKKIVERVFVPDRLVLLFKSRLSLFLDKLKSHWSGPFKMVRVLPFGVVDLLDIKSNYTFIRNGQRLKLYLGGDIKCTREVILLQDEANKCPKV